MLKSNRKHSLVLLLPKYSVVSKAAIPEGSGDTRLVKQRTPFWESCEVAGVGPCLARYEPR